jgi:Tol biopolymer transport system component
MVREVALALVVAVVVAAAAGAAPYGGANGKLLVLDASDVYTVDAAGARQRITFDARNSWPVFSPDGRRIAYAKGSIAPPTAIFVADVDGGGERGVIAHGDTVGAGGVTQLKWAPDGRRVSYAIRGRGLHVVDVATAELTLFPLPGDVFGYDWSPDGSTLVYSDGGDIWLQPLDGSARRAVVDGPNQDVEPEFSPDGTRIAFLRTTERIGIHAIARDGRDAIFVGSTPSGIVGPPSWSPRGDAIAYSGVQEVQNLDARLPTDVSGVWVARADGSGTALVRLSASQPRFSPDGTRLLLGVVWRPTADGRSRFRPGAFTMNADGTCLTRLGSGVAYDWQPLPGGPTGATRCIDVDVSVSTPPTAGRLGFATRVLLRNTGTDAATGVVLTQTFDAPVRVLNAPGCTFDSRMVRCPFLPLQPNGFATKEIFVRPLAAGRLTTSATVDVPGDNDPESNAEELRVDVSPCWLVGTERSDRIVGSPIGERICALGGADDVDGRGGRDVLQGGAGNDVLRARDGQRDIVECGPGRDVAIVDRRDVVRACERVLRA